MRGKTRGVEIPLPDLRVYRVVAEPDAPNEGYWAGAPSVVHDPGEAAFWLAYRTDRPGRGQSAIHLARSVDGAHFSTLLRWTCADLAADWLERPALLREELSGRFKLYLCLQDRSGLAYLAKLADAASPADFDPSTAWPVLVPSGAGGDAKVVKDPWILQHSGQYYLFYVGRGTATPTWAQARTGKVPRGERPYLATSPDGEFWTRSNHNPLMSCTGWHNFHTRLACAWRTRQAVYLVYEGSNAGWHQPEFNIQTGLARATRDFQSITDLTPDAPLLSSPTPGQCATARYFCYARQGERVLWYYEAARPDGAFELRLSETRLPAVSWENGTSPDPGRPGKMGKRPGC